MVGRGVPAEPFGAMRLTGTVRPTEPWITRQFKSNPLYGATLGLWRDGLQAGFTALKFPLLVFLTCGANAALNGCLGQLLGSGLGFRQTTFAILMSFAVTAVRPIVGSSEHFLPREKQFFLAHWMQVFGGGAARD